MCHFLFNLFIANSFAKSIYIHLKAIVALRIVNKGEFTKKNV